MPQLEISTGFYQSDSLPLSAQRCVNWIPVVPEAEALNRRALFDVPGIKERVTTGDTINGSNRGSIVVDGTPYHVNGQAVYSITRENEVTNHGFIAGTERVSLATNGRWLVIVVPGVQTYIIDNASGQSALVSQISDPDFRSAESVSFKDGYFIYTTPDVFFISALNDPFSYDALDFGSAEVRPDKIIVSHIDHNELFVGGEKTIELHQNIGGADFPFASIPGATIQKGIDARHSVVGFDNSFVFLGSGDEELTSVWLIVGSSGVQKISTAAIDNAIQEYTADEIGSAFAMSYAFGGNFFVSFTFTSTRIPSKTFVYDAASSALSGRLVWHERQSGVVDNRWRVSSIVSAYDKLIVADLEDGRIGEFDKEIYSEYDLPIFRMKVSQPFADPDLEPLTMNKLRLTMETGVGLNTGQGEDPQIRFSYSLDGGFTWSYERWRSYGRSGDRRIVPTWRRLGRIKRSLVTRFITTEPVKSVIIRLDGE